MVFPTKQGYQNELKKHKGHELEPADEKEQFITGYKCKTCNKTIQCSEQISKTNQKPQFRPEDEDKFKEDIEDEEED